MAGWRRWVVAAFWGAGSCTVTGIPIYGDTVFAAATGAGAAVDDLALSELGHVAACTLARAIWRGMFHATALPYPGALADWHRRFGGAG